MATQPLQPGASPANPAPRVPPAPNSLAAAASRRGVLGIIAAAPVAALPVAALAVTSATPFRVAEARYRAAMARFDGLPKNLELDDPDTYAREEQAFLASVDEVDEAPVADWHEFADAYEIACDCGYSLPNEGVVFKLLADARRLAGRVPA